MFQKGNQYGKMLKGRKLSTEHKRKIGIASRGRLKSAETIEKIKQAHRDGKIKHLCGKEHPMWKGGISKDREYIKEYHRIYRINNCDKRIVYENVRKARKRKNGGTFTLEQWNKLKEYFNYTCPCCANNNVKLTVDHIIPIKFGGGSDIKNIQPLCGKCNNLKRTKIMKYYPIIDLSLTQY